VHAWYVLHKKTKQVLPEEIEKKETPKEKKQAV